MGLFLYEMSDELMYMGSWLRDCTKPIKRTFTYTFTVRNKIQHLKIFGFLISSYQAWTSLYWSIDALFQVPEIREFYETT